MDLQKHRLCAPSPDHSSPLQGLPYFCLCFQSRARRVSPGRWRSLPGEVETESAGELSGARSPASGAGDHTFCLRLLLLHSCTSNQVSTFLRTSFRECFKSPLLHLHHCGQSCVCILPQQTVHLAVQAPQTEGKVWMAQQIQELGLRRSGWGEVKIIAQFQACSRLSEFNNP